MPFNDLALRREMSEMRENLGLSLNMDADLEHAGYICIHQGKPRTIHFGGRTFPAEWDEACKKVLDAYDRRRSEEYWAHQDTIKAQSEEEQKEFVERISRRLPPLRLDQKHD